jgi:hypothetical protein
MLEKILVVKTMADEWQMPVDEMTVRKMLVG